MDLGEGKTIAVTASIGVAGVESGVQLGAQLVEVADRALYRAKHGGRDRTVLAREVDAAGDFREPPAGGKGRILS